MASDDECGLVAALHDAPAKACLVVTGAGTSAVAALFAVPGASRTVIEAQIPYSYSALTEYVGVHADSHVSVDEARIMAIKAHARAMSLADDDSQRLIGVSCTAAIATDRVRRGENRCHVTTFDGDQTVTYSLVMKKGERSRAGEEKLCRTLILNGMAEAFEIESRLGLELVDGESVERTADR